MRLPRPLVLSLLGAYLGAGTAASSQSLGFQPLPTADHGSMLSVEFGPTRPEHEPWRRWVAATPEFAQHLRWLSDQVVLPREVPVLFTSCGTSNAFYVPQLHTIRICYEYIEQRRKLIQSNVSSPTEEMVRDALIRSTLHVINHEVGHAIVDLLSLPVLGREEDAADGFSAFILLERGGPSDAYSVLQGALTNGQHPLFETGSAADVHSLNDQRFYNLMCWMLGSDTVRFAGFAQKANLPAFRQRSCAHEWAQLRASWIKVLGDNLRPSDSVIAMDSFTGPARTVELMNDQTLQVPAGGYIRQEFHIPFAQCHAHLNVLGLDGGNRDVITMVFDRYSFLSWSSNTFAEPVFQSGQMRQLVSDVPLRGPGDFVLVVNNKFSGFTPKAVKATVTVSCP